jgi:hypothetical protein
LKNKLACTLAKCKYNNDGFCTCKEPILLVRPILITGRGEPDYEIHVFTCANFNPRTDKRRILSPGELLEEIKERVYKRDL